ncbi:YheC/YheD family endospore coat-associated protein [Cohnella abietis]|uniref:ATP-grasp domain-containing protein n=1 Tax=Cohnella abietis TaxID=2507935 RepID=A0A3T1D7H0_9BACL|nr:YheC/YheD family protein [Cohnella abietis]BBI34032.1 hypothetical protein KCTCHS21_34310 [Cohnella abietis]
MNNRRGFVGIMVANRNQRKYVLKQYLRYNTTDMKLFCFTPSSINWGRNSIIGLHRSNRKWVLSKFAFPQVVYNRCYNTDHMLIELLETVIGKNKCFNHINQLNKHEIHNSLSRELVNYLPFTVPYDKENIIHLLDHYKVLYLKPCYGNKGKGVYRLEMMKSGKIHIALHYFTPQIILNDAKQLQETIQQLIGSAPYIIQEGIDIRQLNNQNFDIRALVQKNSKGIWSITNIISRIAYKGSYNTSICEKACLTVDLFNHLFPHEKASSIIGLIHALSLKTAKTIDTTSNYHLGEFSADFALDNNEHLWIIELNGQPQKDIYNEFYKQNAVYKRPIQYAQYLCTN